MFIHNLKVGALFYSSRVSRHARGDAAEGSIPEVQQERQASDRGHASGEH